MENNIKVLITGGAGFIGGALIRKLLKESNYNIFNLDNLSYSSDLKSIDSLIQSLGKNTQKRYKFIKGDISNKETVENVIQETKPELIFHLAAETHVDKSIIYPENFILSNILGTFNLLESSLNYYKKIDPEKQKKFKFIHISTDEVFGSLPQNGFFNENTKYDPRSPYSASKASSDHLVKAWFHTYDLPCIITNCSNNYGPWQYPEKLIPNIISKAIQQKNISIYGSGKNIRDWLYVEDHIDAILLIADKGLPGKNYCIGGNNEKTNLDVAEKICNYLDEINPQINSHKSLIKFVKDRAGHDFRYAIDASLIKQELNWSPKHNFEDGLKNTIDWYLNNKSWLYKI
ncbi:dTDP-D-glucose 4,6-dehydratase [Prochlorococcus marinus str. MIT 9215]|uniref:dTDP-glucose 4,6-dehydratase n=1 Tax=Prochlorococcus marinus (strain MIT 9215) TaxID=93060 RepID=A8G635_PROM2|nr:dTDP-glucose 4,6-dehydratase [Prochlorococcus marinus]ABV51066.1 dTDP-D-glucose 4,6-dehydratase [Prochlorococcus marinus str. MIT 9215]